MGLIHGYELDPPSHKADPKWLSRDPIRLERNVRGNAPEREQTTSAKTRLCMDSISDGGLDLTYQRTSRWPVQSHKLQPSRQIMLKGRSPA